MAKNITLEDLVKHANPKELIATLSFEEGLTLLESLVTAVERGTLPLQTAIESYEKGTLLIAQLREILDGAEKKMKVLKAEG